MRTRTPLRTLSVPRGRPRHSSCCCRLATFLALLPGPRMMLLLALWPTEPELWQLLGVTGEVQTQRMATPATAMVVQCAWCKDRSGVQGSSEVNCELDKV